MQTVVLFCVMLSVIESFAINSYKYFIDINFVEKVKSIVKICIITKITCIKSFITICNTSFDVKKERDCIIIHEQMQFIYINNVLAIQTISHFDLRRLYK